jgi:hypothetical protein
MAASQEELSQTAISLDGARTVRTADQSHSLLLEAFRNASSITVDCSQITEADLSLVQLLLSARKSAAAGGKRLSLSHAAEGALGSVLTRGGFLSADAPAGQRAFWLMSEASDENRS